MSLSANAMVNLVRTYQRIQVFGAKPTSGLRMLNFGFLSIVDSFQIRLRSDIDELLIKSIPMGMRRYIAMIMADASNADRRVGEPNES